MAEPMYSPESANAIVAGEKVGRLASNAPPRLKKSRAPARPFFDWVLRNQILVSSALVLFVISLHILVPQSRTHTRKFLKLSYPSRTEQTYTQGTDDIYFVFAWIINFTALRAISIEWILQPLAGYWDVAKKSHLRFAEQGWLVLYYAVFWGLGMHLWYNSVYWLNNAEIWTAWPAREMTGTFKWYYLVQLAFWIQQILVIHIEQRRKDHAQMLTHHIITCTLISITYVYRYTRAANVVLCLMDVIDLILPIAKILRYLRYETACNIAFGLFVVTWFWARHVMYLKLCYDIWVDVPGPTTMLFGCYNGATNELIPDMPAQPDKFAHLLWPFQNLDGVICLNQEVKYIFLGMLLLLQTLSIIWFGMILKVIAGMLMGVKVEDVRSDDEGELEVEVEENGGDVPGERRQMNVTDLNICVGGGEETGVGRHEKLLSAPKPRVSAITSGRRRLGGAENRKELLSRIGCEKPIE